MGWSDLQNMIWEAWNVFLLIYDQQKRIRESEDKNACLNNKNLEECNSKT